LELLTLLVKPQVSVLRENGYLNLVLVLPNLWCGWCGWAWFTA